MKSLDNCKFVSLRSLQDSSGNITVVEAKADLPFEIQRVYFVHNVIAGSVRGGHAHKELEQLIIAINGSLEIELSDGYNSKIYTLDSPELGLYVCPLIWRDIRYIRSDSTCLVLASKKYDESDYIRNHKTFLDIINEN